MIKSAREFAGRPVPLPSTGSLSLPHDSLCAPNERARGGLLEVNGRNFGASRRIHVFNGRWVRCAFVNDGQACYRSPELNPEELFLYFRALEGRWVVSDTITRASGGGSNQHSEEPIDRNGDGAMMVVYASSSSCVLPLHHSDGSCEGRIRWHTNGWAVDQTWLVAAGRADLGNGGHGRGWLHEVCRSR